MILISNKFFGLNVRKGIAMKEKILKSTGKGLLMLLVSLIMLFGGCGLIVYGGVNELPVFIAGGVIFMLLGFVLIMGIKVVRPQEAVVYTLFGKYIGTLKEEGFHFINPFAISFNPAAHTRLGQSGDVKSSINMDAAMGKKISLKAMTLSNSKQKVNDVLGNPVEVGVAVIWKVVDTAAAVFNVDNFKEYLSLQCDTSVRDIVKLYPYDVAPDIDTTGDGVADDGSLRGSTTVVAERIKKLIQEKVNIAGLEIVEARITYLAYAPEIASAMLQRQQATAIIDAKKVIVEGAVGMVEMALEMLEEKGTVELDEERKAAMVSNLLVVLCGNHEAQPVVNSGSLY